MVSEVFPETAADARLDELLGAAAQQGAELAVLPELPLNHWCPARRNVDPADAEGPGGRRQQRLASAARRAGVAVLGGIIHLDPDGGRRTNRALLYGADGELLASYDKLHLPEEEGFWETDHYQPGDQAPRPVAVAGTRIGVQICSDLYRPQGCQMLAAAGATVLLGPRASEPATWPRWRRVLGVNAMLSCAFLVSVNRQDSVTGGPSAVFAPDGEVLLETTDPLAVIDLETARVEQARRQYPGYLDVRSEIYAAGWRAAARARS